MSRLGYAFILVALALPTIAQAENPRGRLALFQNQTGVLDGRASKQYSASSRLQPKKADVPEVEKVTVSTKSYSGSYKGPYVAMARAAARKHGVPEDLFLRLVQQESGWNATAKSHKGAIGLAQLMPATAQHLRVDPHLPAQNLDGGAKYLKRQFDRFKSWRLALAAYNAGPGAVQKYNGVPPYRETRNYVLKIWGS